MSELIIKDKDPRQVHKDDKNLQVIFMLQPKLQTISFLHHYNEGDLIVVHKEDSREKFKGRIKMLRIGSVSPDEPLFNVEFVINYGHGILPESFFPNEKVNREIHKSNMMYHLKKIIRLIRS